MPPPPPHALNGQPPLPPTEARKVTSEKAIKLREREEEEKKDDPDDGEKPSAFPTREAKKDVPSPSAKEDKRLSKEDYFDDIVKRNLARSKNSDSDQEGSVKKTNDNRVVSPPTSDGNSSNDNSPVPISGKSVTPAPAPHASYASVQQPPPPGPYPLFHHYYPYPPPPMGPPGTANHAPGFYSHPPPPRYGVSPLLSSPQSPSSRPTSQLKSTPSTAQVTASKAVPLKPPAGSRGSVKVARAGKPKVKAPKTKKKVNTTPTQSLIANFSTDTHDRCVPLPPPVPSHFYG